MVSEQWFVRTEGMGAAALDAVATGRMTIIPQRFTKIYNNWMGGIQDWCISRQLWWGHRIPVWYCFASPAEAEASEGRGEQYVVARNKTEAREKVQCYLFLSAFLLHALGSTAQLASAQPGRTVLVV